MIVLAPRSLAVSIGATKPDMIVLAPRSLAVSRSATLPDMMVSVMLRLLSDRPSDWREEEEEVLEVSEGGRAVLRGVAVGVAFPLDLRRSFSAFSVSISFWWWNRYIYLNIFHHYSYILYNI